ncbi:uncharacterized protein H6S33_003816 [Morchella sextelata]|uniref:uncharacterized protein n=1 Tax=Morchella sextelata TaxID=1174677 RepID=UPI001D055038|nr:uncharacterized protein H6S33_003816 [Morchella sextelata]KAH0606155.1 hypothetical protein H6S33_003816 [Morchella sextelata]
MLIQNNGFLSLLQSIHLRSIAHHERGKNRLKDNTCCCRNYIGLAATTLIHDSVASSSKYLANQLAANCQSGIIYAFCFLIFTAVSRFGELFVSKDSLSLAGDKRKKSSGIATASSIKRHRLSSGQGACLLTALFLESSMREQRWNAYLR